MPPYKASDQYLRDLVSIFTGRGGLVDEFNAALTASLPSGTPLPAGAVPVTGSSGNVAAAATSATLAASATLNTWLTGFQVTGAGATAASVILVTVTGVVGGTLTYVLVVPAGVTASITPLSFSFSPALRSSAINTAIVVNVPSFGTGNTNAAVSAQGYQA